MKTIWLVDDSPTILLSISGILDSAGYGSRKFERPADVLTALKGGVPDVLMTDLNMPEMDGITLTREVRKLPTCKSMPILMLTTESQQDKRNDAKAAGASGWLVKPVRADHLIQVLKKVLST